jgi:nuclear pore complex protein Nup205
MRSAHVILDIVSVGVPRMRPKGKDRQGTRRAQGATMHTEPPTCSEQAVLSNHPPVLRAPSCYLRTREDFFVRHLAVIPSAVPEATQEPFIEVLYHDGSRVLTNVATICAFIDLRSRTLDLAALDLHVLTNKGHHDGVLENRDAMQDVGEVDWEDEMGMTVQPFREMRFD